METDSGGQEAVQTARQQPRLLRSKGRLYFVLKDLINAARALHASEPGKGKADVVPAVPAPTK